MGFEDIYVKLPNSIKYNKHVFKFFTKLANFLRHITSPKKQKQLTETHHEIFNLLLTSCEIKTTGTLRNIQLLYLELLRFIDNVCKKYDIDYFIDYGTLLGAFRHGGFILWDDDVDVSLLRKDYNKLLEVLPKEIEKHPILKEKCSLTLLRENNENYFKNYNTIYEIDENVVTQHKFYFLQFFWLKPFIIIDIFPKDFIQNDKFDFLEQNYSVEKFKFFDQLHKNEISNFSATLKEKREILGFSDEKNDYFIDALDSLSFNKFKPYKYDECYPLSTIKFEDYYFKCPKNASHVLELFYGKDFMNIPNSLRSREVRDVIESQFDSKEEMEKAFEESLEILREINENYQ